MITKLTGKPGAFRVYEQAQAALKRGDYKLAAGLMEEAAQCALTPEGRALLEERAREIKQLAS